MQSEQCGRQGENSTLILRADGNLSSLADFPHLFTWPSARPFKADMIVFGGRTILRTQLKQILDFESRGSQNSNPVTMRKMKLHTWITRPLYLAHFEGRALEGFLCR